MSYPHPSDMYLFRWKRPHLTRLEFVLAFILFGLLFLMLLGYLQFDFSVHENIY